MRFILKDIDSPEYRSDLSSEQKILKEMRVEEVMVEVERVRTKLSKKRGMELLKAKQKKIRNTHSENENQELLKSISTFIQNLLCLGS